MTIIDTLKQKIIHLVMGMDDEQALEVVYTVMSKFSNPSSVAEDELTDEEWNEIQQDMNEIEKEEFDKNQEIAQHLKQWKSGK